MKIFIERLKDGTVQKIEETLSADFLEIHEKELTFHPEVKVNGEAYLADDHLIVRLSANATAQIPCSICNTMTPTTIAIRDLTHPESIAEIKSGVFDLSPVLREAILLQTPPFTECNKGKCPERTSLSPFLKTKKDSPSVHFPFDNL